ncbi:MAG: hypothetical protein R6X13_04525 [bacterium]
MKSAILLLVVLLVAAPASASLINKSEHPYEIRGVAEVGWFGWLANDIQFGAGSRGTKFDYVGEGRQNILFPFQRLSLEMQLKPRHTFVFLYQPLDVRSVATLEQDLLLDSTLFPAGTAMNLRYGFDFYRASWLFDFWPQADRELAVGLSLQIRDAVISFTAVDGSAQRVYTDVGPVPALKARVRIPINQLMWLGAEVDGIYAQGKGVTGSTNVESSFKGAIIDASLRYGFKVNESIDAFLNARYLGGGAEGSQVDPENPNTDGYTSNWLGAVSLSAGFGIK